MNRYLINIGRALLCLGIVAVAPGAGAFDLGEIEVHGFVTSTATKTTNNNVFSLNSVDGDLGWFEAGINFNVEPVDNLRIGMQLYSRSLGDQGDGDVVIDWATGDYRVRDWFGFRVGKNKMPVGLYNTTRDADMTRPTILLPQSIYSENLRDLINAYIGGEIYGSIALGGLSDLEYQLFYGTQNLNDTYVISTFMNRGALASLNFLPLPMTDVTYTIDNIDADMDHIFGGALRWQTPLDGLLFGATYSRAEATFSNRTVYSGWMQQGPALVPTSFAVNGNTDWSMEGSWVLSGEYRRGGWLVAAEYWESEVVNVSELSGLPFPLPPLPVSVEDQLGYYGQVAYRFNNWLQLGAYYSVFYSDKDDKDGDRFAFIGEPAFRAWSKDLTVSARFDFTRNMLFKLEGHFVDGAALVSAIDNSQGLEDEYTIVLGRFTFYF